MVAGFDWATTSLGPPDGWPAVLRTAVGVCLTSRFPMLVVWGDDLVQIYNDGYRQILGTEKHPGALGAPVREVWPEIWDEIGPLFESVLTTARPTFTEHGKLILERNGYQEQTYFTWSYSPLHADDGTVGGVLDVVLETTDLVIAQRRLSCLADLAHGLAELKAITDTCLQAVATLSAWRQDLPAVDIHLMVDDHPTRVASNRREGVGLGLEAVEQDLIARAVATDGPVVLGDPEDGRRPATRVARTVGGTEGGPVLVLVLDLQPQRPYDEAYAQFVALVADAVGQAFDRSYRHTVEIGEYRYISDTLQRSMLQPADDLPTVAARYLPATGNLAVGGDWYDVIDLGEDRRALVVGDCVGHGIEAAAAMGQLRSAARAMLLDGGDPATVLSGLDTFASSVEGAFCATVACAVVEKGDARITYSLAGHPPPLVVGPRGARWLKEAVGPPLSVIEVSRYNEVVSIDRDDLIVMYTDGLVERRHEHIDLGLARLAAVAAMWHGASVAEVADGILKELLGPDAADDVVLVVKAVATDG